MTTINYNYEWKSWNTGGTSSSTYNSDSNYVWNSWVTCNPTTDTAISSNDTTWSYWVTDNSTSSCATTDITWSSWIGQSELYDYGIIRESKKERRRRIKRERREKFESEKRVRLLKEKKEKAENVALSLLGELIGNRELKIYKETGRLFVKGNNFDYLLHKQGKVQRYEKDKIVDLCIHFKQKYSYPETDNVIGLKLLAEENDKKFNELSNVIRINDNENIQLPECACGGLLN